MILEVWALKHPYILSFTSYQAMISAILHNVSFDVLKLPSNILKFQGT